jgi:D-hydroxyproline dehydrogenase subunit gamma
MADVAAPTVDFTLDGTPCRVPAGASVAAALLNAGVRSFHASVHGGARAPLCGMGSCYECRVTIDGVAHTRACLVLLADGMDVRTDDGSR